MIRVLSILLAVLFLAGCSNMPTDRELMVGLLVEDTIDDQGWNRKAYEGLLNIHSNLDVDVVLEEGVNSEQKAHRRIKELVDGGVTLIFGHGHAFAEYFSTIHNQYPDVHFVSFNGEVKGENITSLHFEGYAMGYFGGMVAASMSETHKVGVIAAFPWQPEVEGFVDGAKYMNESEAFVRYVGEWTDADKALELFQELQKEQVDVFYPAGDGYHVPVVEAIKDQGDFAIGYVGDQADLGGSTILTSTVQHVDDLYVLVAKRFQEGKLESGNLYYDFQDGVVSLGEFSSVVPDEVREQITDAISTYIQTGQFPHEEER
ncbi:BMP family ABC transporter substrate-binding protein [Halalkalibacterium halodurans]|uniref:BMP family ABC transporter substrate-binding protein n=1 Tax=Halalkalibacterium halodurans TaxID=86665 RepID=UPI002E21E911|nr:BMP family ABC transporter substrate-binding protein [Halalkalibacterium halodurans]